MTENNLAMVGQPFTKKCSVRSDGNRVQEIVYHDKCRSKVIYQVGQQNRQNEHGAEQSINEIFQVLPCVGDDLVDDILPDLMEGGQTGMTHSE